NHFGFNHPRCHIHGSYGHRKNSYNCLEKQLSRAFNDDEFLKLVEFNPKINLSEDENNYYIHADLPGMKKNQVKMEINEDHILTISDINENNETKENEDTKKHQETTESEIKNKKIEDNKNNERKYSIIESSYGKFSRSFNIPEDANLENIQAKMENGVLEVIINKIEPPKNQKRSIQIQ
ncbi:HSP20-like chaperone, partial [Neocallimastix sp. 'constans']